MKIGLFLSRDGGTISKTLDLTALSQAYSHLSVVKIYGSFFDHEDQQDILKTSVDEMLDGVVFAGNSPKYFENVMSGSAILEALGGLGINANRIAFANLKEQVALPHEGINGRATRKARLLIDVALAKVEMSHPIKSLTVSPRRAVMIIGSAPGGVIAAREFLTKGYRIYLVEKENSLNKATAGRRDMAPTLSMVQLHNKSVILLNTVVKDVSGWCGEYNVVLDTSSGSEEITVGGIVLAVGDDKEWIGQLRPKLQLDVNDEGQIRSKHGSVIKGETKDKCIWFIPSTQETEGLSGEIAAASTVVLALTTILDRNEISHPVTVSEVDESVCGGCGTCVKTCAFSASSIDAVRKVSVIDPRRCKGCGNCVVACPTGARDLVTFPEDYVIKSIDILSAGTSDNGQPSVLAILCNSCGYPAADSAGEMSGRNKDLKYSPNVLPICVECGGNVDTQYILEAFNNGFDGVAITVCLDGCCHHVVGNTDMQRRLGLFREVLRSRHIDSERLRIIHVAPHDGETFGKEINDFCADLKTAKGGA